MNSCVFFHPCPKVYFLAPQQAYWPEVPRKPNREHHQKSLSQIYLTSDEDLGRKICHSSDQNYNTLPLSSNIILYEWRGGALYSQLSIYYFMLSITPYSMHFQLIRDLKINRRYVSPLNPPPPLKLETKTEKSQKGPNEITFYFLFLNSGLKL